MSRYIFPAATGLLLVLFFMGLPSSISTGKESPAESKTSSRGQALLTPADLIIMFCITILFCFVDFFHLGNSVSVETFDRPGQEGAVFTLEGDADRFALFTGVGYGTYTFETSVDGIDYFSAATFRQDAGDVLRWIYIKPDSPLLGRYVRLTCTGEAYLGEAVFLDASGEPLPVICTKPAFADEQDRFCAEYSFMNSTYFDEIYHARTAWEHLHSIYPYEISHPPLGKLIISLGILLFGMTPFGWRFSGTLCGVLMLPILYIFVKKMFSSTRVASCATIVFATDFMHFVQTRIATIDSYAVFFILLMYYFMYCFVSSGDRRALALSGFFFGLGAASKWTCLYAGAGLAVIWLVYWILHRSDGFFAFLKNAAFCIPFFILIPCLIYYLSYIPYGRASEISGIFNRRYLDLVLSNQQYMFSYHAKLVAEHPYSSVWYQWMLNIRPILYYLQYFNDGTRSSFGAFLNPALCWGGLLALFVLFYSTVMYRDRKAAFLLAGYFAQLLPWIFITRLTFEYHYFPCSVFLVLALAYVFRQIETGNRFFRAYLCSFVCLSTLLFILFFPALSGLPVNNTLATKILGWFPSWPF